LGQKARPVFAGSGQDAQKRQLITIKNTDSALRARGFNPSKS
jgi:hypothetical protein